jgi:hypothetical protein
MSINLEDRTREALLAELDRQAANGGLKVTRGEDGSRVALEGELDIDDLVMVIAGSLAGGP